MHRCVSSIAGRVLAFFIIAALFGNVSQAQSFQVIHNFTGGRDGANPYGGLTMDSAGNIYGVASAGGSGTCVLNGTPGCGTVYKLTQNSGSWGFTALYHFLSNPDGAAPVETVTVGPSGNLFGVTVAGGEGSCSFGGDIECGTIFEVKPTGGGDRVLYRFADANDGGQPFGNVIFIGNNQYGTTQTGGDLSCGSNGCGTVYQLSATGKETVIHQFTGLGGDGAYPYGGLVADSAGHLYGTTSSGGSSTLCNGGCGTIYELTQTKFGWNEKILYSFTGTADGENPDAGLIIDSTGNLYGNTWQGGGGGGGTVFKLKKHQDGSYTLLVLYPFPIHGYSIAPLVMDANGNIFGATQNGGANDDGMVYELKPNATGWSFFDLHDFTNGADGGNPLGALVIDSAGNLYGTTLNFGAFTCGSGTGCGVIYKVTP
jgi:uncharacterized repeat protein (TIGR03803 family)